jgi:hypothetical protein
MASLAGINLDLVKASVISGALVILINKTKAIRLELSMNNRIDRGKERKNCAESNNNNMMNKMQMHSTSNSNKNNMVSNSRGVVTHTTETNMAESTMNLREVLKSFMSNFSKTSKKDIEMHRESMNKHREDRNMMISFNKEIKMLNHRRIIKKTKINMTSNSRLHLSSGKSNK